MEMVAIVGLGSVGLPLAVPFGKLTPTVAYELSSQKIETCRRHVDASGTITGDELRAAGRLTFTTGAAELRRLQ